MTSVAVRESTATQHASSGINLWPVLKSVMKLGTGEATARLASFALFAYITRVYGVGLLGIMALAQTVMTYVTVGTDQGLIMIGARIVARSPTAARAIIGSVLRRRLILCAVAVSLGSAYALWGPVPEEARFYVLGFVLAVIPYAFSLDWVAWGLNHMGWLGGWRALVSVLFVGGAVLAMRWTGTTLLPLVLSRIAAASAGALLLWGLWLLRWRRRGAAGDEHLTAEHAPQLSWGGIFNLGAATLFNLMFNNVDTLFLGGMTTVAEVGRYNAAYKILFLIFSGYYLLTQSLYPHLAAWKDPYSLRRWFFCALSVVALLGTAIAAGIWVFSAPLLTLIYGSSLGSVRLLHILLIALPMDFCAALVGTLLASRGRDRLLLLSTGSAVALNIGLNLLLIPRMQAQGAAWATVASYSFLLVILTAFASRRDLLGTPWLLASACAGR
jgi:O-antigen/teichoic acid export membrane protein